MNRRGAVLIFALWTVSFLTLLAVSIGTDIRQQMTLVKRLDERDRLNAVVQAAVRKSAAVIRHQMDGSGFLYTTMVKMKLHDNAEDFSDIRLKGDDHADVNYTSPDTGDFTSRPGVIDEERKININTTDKRVLQDLLTGVLGERADKAKALADAILDWRHYGDSELHGFFSDDYYANLQYPYVKKDAKYETLDELLLVKGIDRDLFERLIPYVTIYGDGKVNVNTATTEVLSVLGLSGPLALKIVTVRRGADGVDGTSDDHVFQKAFDLAAEVNAAMALDVEEVKQIDFLNAQGVLAATSSYFTIDAFGALANGGATKKVRAVYGARENKLLYWKEK